MPGLRVGGFTTSQTARVQKLNLSVQYGFSQIISEPTHILQNSSTWTDLIFTDQPNLVINSRIKLSLYGNCHHQIAYAKFNLQIINPPPYQRLVWVYKNANPSSIEKANVEQVNILNDALFNIFSNFVRSKVNTVDDRDPPWINEEIKCKIKSKSKTSQQYF